MTIFHVFVLSLIQGATEFLPVSSSAHLVLYNKFVIGLKNDLSLDIALHLGSLLAVILLVSKTLKKHVNKVLIKNGVSKSVFFMALATFPLVFMALILEYARLLDLSRQVEIIAFSNLIFALLLFVSDRKPSQRKFSDITARDVLVIGIWQSFAAFPGASRSGASITGARFLNFGRKEAIIISAILSIPAIIISSGYIGFKFFNSPNNIDIEFTVYATLFSFIFSYLALKFFIKFGETFSFTPYVIYRILLGLTLLTVLYI
jgi:undecaprenyl-diphosphatase